MNKKVYRTNEIFSKECYVQPTFEIIGINVEQGFLNNSGDVGGETDDDELEGW